MGSLGLNSQQNTQRGQSQACQQSWRGPSGTLPSQRGAAGEAPTCRKPLLDEGEAVAGADELNIAARQRAPLAGELHGQGGRGTRPLRELESGQERAHTCDLKVPHETLTSPERHAAHPRARFASKGNEMPEVLQVKPAPMVVPEPAASPGAGGRRQTPSSSQQIFTFQTCQRYEAAELRG